jgi:predicted HicB family RNase H-like nuclease
LATQSVNLSVSDFQKEIQEKHLSKLMSVQLLLDPSRKDSIDQKKKASKVLIITDKPADDEVVDRVMKSDENNVVPTSLNEELVSLRTMLTQKDDEITLLRQQQSVLLNQLKETSSQTTREPKTPAMLPDTLPSLVNTKSVTTTIPFKTRYDPAAITEADVKQIWLTIMKRFTNGRYMS